MFSNNLDLLREVAIRSYSRQGEREVRAARAAFQLYQRSRWRERLGRVWAALTGHAHHLFDLKAVEAVSSVRGRHHLGIQAVPIRQIRGTWGRCNDFDATFRPRNEHNRRRWLSLATARALGATLSPVGLVQIGGLYFVQDGHHRISVARALGEEMVDAMVTVWEIADPLPWERLAVVQCQSAP